MSSLLLMVPFADAGWIKASSSYTDSQRTRYVAERAADGLLSTSWAEDEEDGLGEGSWMELTLDRPTDIHLLSIWPGKLSEGSRSYREYSRPRRIQVTLSGGSETVEREFTLEDKAARVDLPLEGKGNRIKIEVLEAYEGFVFSEMHITELAVNFDHCEDQLGSWQTWLDGAAGQAALAAHEKRVREAYNVAAEEGEGEREALEFIMDQVSDGPEYARRQVSYSVALGYRAAALRPDSISVQALDKLKNPNSIPAFEQAALRSLGEDARRFTQMAEIFDAYADLIGGPDYSVAPWGEEGWSPGALQSFGEPLDLEVDRMGQIYVADVGNSRVQRFKTSGVLDRAWGDSEADITNAWLAGTRPWYVSGARAGSEDGQFENTLDVEMIPGKESDDFAVLDGSGRVQIFASSGGQLASWEVPVEGKLKGGLGGQAHLAYVAKKDMILVSWLDQLHGFTRGGELLGTWDLDDGVPSQMEASSKGQLLLVYEQRIMRYDVDGFRYGTYLDGRSLLGSGFEYFAFTYDEKGKLWIVTDGGRLVKLKRPGKIQYDFQISDYDLVHPRIAVLDDKVFLTDRDAVTTLDALQMAMDQEAAESEE